MNATSKPKLTVPVAIVPQPTAGAAPSVAAPSGPPEEDVQLVMEQAHVSREAALEALQGANGAPAEAIMALLTRGH